MQASSSTEASSRLSTGRLEGISVPDLFWSLSRARATGVLHLTAKGITKRVYLEEGRILFAASGDPNDRLGEMLLRDGVIRLDHLEQAIARLPGGKRLGTILVEAGHLSPEALVRGVVGQVRRIVLGLFPWEEGEYTFVEGPLPTEEVVTLGMRTGDLLLEGIRSVRSFSRIRRSVGPPRTRFRTVEGWRAVADGLDLGEGGRQMLNRLDGGGETLERLCDEVYLSNFEIYQSLWAFKVLGLIQEVERLPEPTAFGVEGRFDHDGLAGLLVRLGRASETGVLYASHGSLERTFHVREGRCVFATSNSIDDGLISYLLRRGVISLRDREETARRLLSNKRVGTILLEMGVIDEADLERLVREHLLEILYDTFRWPEGEWLFSAGELPTLEAITVDRTLDDLVFQGIRGVASWPRVREGCGGLGTRLELTPDYLSVLDRLTVSPEDWELVTSLKNPKTPLELCRAHALGDFRVCQTLWALRLLGAVAEAPLEDTLEATLGPSLVGAALGAADAEPEPIAPAVVASDEAFEVTPAEDPEAEIVADEPAIPPSDWSEPGDDAESPWAWKPSEDAEAVALSSDENPSEIVNEAWRLATPEAESWGRPPEPGPEPTMEMESGPAPEPDLEPVALGPDPAFEMASAGDAVAADPETSPRDEPPPAPTFEVDSEDFSNLDSAAEPEPPSLDHTMRIPREQIEALFGAPAAEPPAPEPPAPEEPADEGVDLPAPEEASAPPEPEPDPEPWDPPSDLDPSIDRFVAKHKVVFRVIRSEVGAGAANFVRSCGRAVGFGESFGAVDPQPDGSFDVVSLRAAVVEHRIDDAGDGFRRWLDEEIGRLRPQIGEKRAEALLEQLAKVDDQTARPPE